MPPSERRAALFVFCTPSVAIHELHHERGRNCDERSKAPDEHAAFRIDGRAGNRPNAGFAEMPFTFSMERPSLDGGGTPIIY